MNKCNLVTDLLPLYAENLLSEDTKQLVERHLARCAECSKKSELLKTPAAAPVMANPSEETRAVLKRTRRKLRNRTAIVAAAAVFLSAIVAACAVFFPVRIVEVRDILYPYGVGGKPTDLESVWAYPTDSMIKLGKPIETYAKEPTGNGYPLIAPRFTLILPEPYRDLGLSNGYAVELENSAAMLVVRWRSNSFKSVFGISPENVDGGDLGISPVAVYCKEHSLTTWTQIADYAITYRKSEFSLLFSPNRAASYTADILRVRDCVIGEWIANGETCSPQIYHSLRGAYEGYAFSHEGAQGSWDVFVTTDQFVYHLQIFNRGGITVLFPDGESIAKLLSTATFA